MSNGINLTAQRVREPATALLTYAQRVAAAAGAVDDAQVSEAALKVCNEAQVLSLAALAGQRDAMNLDTLAAADEQLAKMDAVVCEAAKSQYAATVVATAETAELALE